MTTHPRTSALLQCFHFNEIAIFTMILVQGFIAVLYIIALYM